MNIQQYYRYTASISINAGLISIIVPIFLLFIVSMIMQSREIVLLSVPFFIYSLFCFHHYRLNIDRCNETNVINQNEMESAESLLLENQLLLAYLPSPSLHLLLYSSNGQLAGEIKDEHQKLIRWFLPYWVDKMFSKNYVLYDEKNRLVATFKISKKGIIDVTDHEGKHLGSIKEMKSKNFHIKGRTLNTNLSLDSERFFTDIKYRSEREDLVGRIRKGWVPLKWGVQFKDANIPVLTFGEKVTEEEKLLLFALMANHLRYRDH